MSTHVLQFSNCYHRGKPEKMKENSVTSILLKYFYYHVLKFTSFFSLIPFSSPLLFYAPPLFFALSTLFPLREKKKKHEENPQLDPTLIIRAGSLGGGFIRRADSFRCLRPRAVPGPPVPEDGVGEHDAARILCGGGGV